MVPIKDSFQRGVGEGQMRVVGEVELAPMPVLFCLAREFALEHCEGFSERLRYFCDRLGLLGLCCREDELIGVMIEP